MTSTDHLVLGVDIGGTKVAAGVVNTSGDVLAKTRNPMVVRESAEAGLAAVTRAIDAALDSGHRVSAIGISVPGYIDPRRGVVINATNLPCWKEYALGPTIQQRYKLPTRIDNDANAAALAEVVWGAGAGYRFAFYVSLGTGVGTGLVINRRVYHGRTGWATEGGHVSIDPNGPLCLCGKHGCIEMYASGTAIATAARERLAHARRSKILELAGGKVQRVTAEMVGKAALEGDPLASELLQSAADSLAQYLGNVIIDLLEPDVIVIGGGVGLLMASFFGYMRERIAQHSVNPRASEIPIVSAMYGASSGLPGAAALVIARLSPAAAK